MAWAWMGRGPSAMDGPGLLGGSPHRGEACCVATRACAAWGQYPVDECLRAPAPCTTAQLQPATVLPAKGVQKRVLGVESGISR